MNIRRSLVLAATLAVALATAMGATGCGHLKMMMQAKDVSRPVAAEFGIGPRTSAAGQFTATLHPDQALRPRKLQTVRVAIVDAAGTPAIIELLQRERAAFRFGPTSSWLSANRRGVWRCRHCSHCWKNSL